MPHLFLRLPMIVSEMSAIKDDGVQKYHSVYEYTLPLGIWNASKILKKMFLLPGCVKKCGN